MGDWSEPIRKKGFILNFQTKKLQEVSDRNIVSSWKERENIKIKKMNFLGESMSISRGVREAEHAWPRHIRSGLSSAR